MKRIFTIIISVLVLSNFVSAQNFTLVPKSSKIQGASTKNVIQKNISFTNNSLDIADSVFNYEVIEVSTPSAWVLVICDPFTCLEGSGVVGFKSSFIMNKNDSGFFKVDFSSNGTPGNGTARIVVRSAKTSYADTITVEGKVWNVSVKDVKQNKEFSFYPNPAKDELFLKYYSKESFQVEVYNILGSKVKTFTLNGGQANVNIEDLSNGIYFLRFKDDEKVISKTFTKN
jgi:hypothetical protein